MNNDIIMLDIFLYFILLKEKLKYLQITLLKKNIQLKSKNNYIFLSYVNNILITFFDDGLV